MSLRQTSPRFRVMQSDDEGIDGASGGSGPHGDGWIRGDARGECLPLP